ncbi:MAG: hypothetical protein EHM23_04745 [Acidobacteria bacterium]|nr:MAG: hypothetical protein EHM23_04745 [Acidobacteriota bacterium]
MLLRQYFFDRYRELHGQRDLFPGTVAARDTSEPVDPMAEQFVNVQVVLFITELEQKLGAMKSTVKELESVRQDALSDQSTDNPSTRARVRELAQDVSKRAGDLFDMVAIVAINLRAKGAVEPQPSPAADFFANELSFLRKQVGKAEGRLNALFLKPTHTVDLEELRGDNVLTELKSIEEVSKDIKKKINSFLPDNTDKAE